MPILVVLHNSTALLRPAKAVLRSRVLNINFEFWRVGRYQITP
jgi:hypothetical protein